MGYLIIALCVISCSNTITRGHLKQEEQLAQIKPGVTTKSEVNKLLGSPSSESTFGDKTWYYISVTKETRSILPTKTLDQECSEIVFDKNDTVKSVRKYAMSDSKNIEISTNITPTEGQHLGFFEQIFANLGRFNKNQDTTSNKHGSTTSPSGYPSR